MRLYLSSKILLKLYAKIYIPFPAKVYSYIPRLRGILLFLLVKGTFTFPLAMRVFIPITTDKPPHPLLISSDSSPPDKGHPYIPPPDKGGKGGYISYPDKGDLTKPTPLLLPPDKGGLVVEYPLSCPTFVRGGVSRRLTGGGLIVIYLFYFIIKQINN